MKNFSKAQINVLLFAFGVLVLIGCKKTDDPINKKDPVITWTNPADIIYGTVLSTTQLNATADVPGTFVYTPVIGTKLNAGVNQDLKVDFTPTDATSYNTASKTVKINVTAIVKQDPIITWANPADIIYGTVLSTTQLNATANVPGTFVYTPVIGTKLNAGVNQDLKADFTPTDATSYNTASKTVKINVTAIVKQDPIITWANPADITLPTALSATQLNATANIPGTFVYTPAIGTVLSIGANQNLRVDFTPTDAIYYNNATKTVPINITATGTVTDFDGNVYHTVVIGTQTWTVENLKVTHYRNGDPIANVTDNAAWTALSSGAYCWFDNDISNKATYGALYNWFTVSDTRNIAPEGWHVPSDAEWTTLITSLEGENVAGGKMKEIGMTHWLSPNTGATNESGFSATPAGYRYADNGEFHHFGYNVDLWSTTSYDASNAWFHSLANNSAICSRYNGAKKGGSAIRCVKD